MLAVRVCRSDDRGQRSSPPSRCSSGHGLAAVWNPRAVRAEFLTLRTRGFLGGAGRGPGHSRLSAYTCCRTRRSGLVSLTLAVARGILLESALSFFGVGVQPPTPSWGNMLYQAQSTLATEPWLAFAPGLFILMTTLSVNLAGDRLATRRT